ncbi:U-scoloptoxin(01)-Cw1a-like [Palaemon carinicauda]|uniref:U-scoloptoxin(01)-Cw1a-like n=1 Tax=Palaemon carinicauda TaxID=392227 RepID=UPI0035B5D6F1
MKVIAVAFVLVAAAVAAASVVPGIRHRRDSFPDLFELPSNASLILGNIVTGFSCANLPYGYYADTANGCLIFHICLPYINFGDVITRQFSFFCGEGTMFDQERLICDFPENALPCEQAAQYTYVNEYFGRTDRNFLE